MDNKLNYFLEWLKDKKLYRKSIQPKKLMKKKINLMFKQ